MIGPFVIVTTQIFRWKIWILCWSQACSKTEARICLGSLIVFLWIWNRIWNPRMKPDGGPIKSMEGGKEEKQILS